MSTKQEDERNRRKPGEGLAASNSNPACDQCRTRKIRCDREAPSCSNCRKANLPCDFTNKGKRINHTKQLVEDFSFLSGRLESIDASIAKITQRLELDSMSTPGSPSSQIDAAVPNDDLNHFTRHSSPAGTIEPSETCEARRGVTGTRSYTITRDGSGAETYYGPTAGRSLLQQTRSYIDDLLNTVKDEDDEERTDEFRRLRSALSKDPTVKTELRKCNDTFPFGAVGGGVQTSCDGTIVSQPPQTLVESSLDFFLEEVNTVLPLFDGDHLRSVVREQYSSPQQGAHNAWNLVFNNIVVLVMGIKLKTALSMNVRRRDYEDDIFLPFLSNSHRAFSSLNDYSSPRLVNVQALVTLALVAADHFPNGFFESIVHKACALGREMGLERYVETARLSNKADSVERRRVFWALYVLDKRRTFLTGKPCDLLLEESDLETPKFVQDEMWAKNSLARIHMMSIWEEIWKNLYSSRAMRNPPRYREEQIDRLRKYLKSWVTTHKPILERPERVEMGNATCMRLELRYSFHVAQILVHRRLDKSDNLQQQINNARAALKIVKDISQGQATVSGISLLGRLFRTYPILPFYEIHRRTMYEVDDECKADMELLQTYINAIRVFHSPVQPAIYYNKLSAGLEWCMNVATVLHKVQDRPQAAIPMSRTASAAKLDGASLSRKSTGKRDAESVNDDSAMEIDPKAQRRRTSAMDTNSSNNGTTTADTSSSGSVGPDTPSPGYFTEFSNIDPFASVDQKLAVFPMNHLTTPSTELPDLNMTSGPMVIPQLPNPMPDGKDPFGMNIAFNYPTPAGTINPSRASTSQAASRPPSNPTSPHHNATDLSSLVARLPPGGQQALTSVPPSATFTPESFSTFNTPLLDDSFTNVGHHPDLITAGAPGHHTDFSHFAFDFAHDHHMGFPHMDGMMSIDSI